MPDTPWLTVRIAAATELSKHCSITSYKSTCWSLFNFSCLQRKVFSGDRSQHVKPVYVTKQVKCEDQFQCLSAYQPYQPLKKTCINQCHTCPWLCQHCVGVEVVSPENLQKAMNIFSSQDRSLKVELFEMQNHLPTIHCGV